MSNEIYEFEIHRNAEGNVLAYAGVKGAGDSYRIAGPKAWGGSKKLAAIEITQRDLVEFVRGYAPGALVDLAAPSAASAATTDSHNFEVCQHFNNWLIGQGLLLTNHTEESDGPMAPAINWIASVQAAIAATSPKCELTDEQIQAITTKAVRNGKVSWVGYQKDDEGLYTIPQLSPYHFDFARAIAAASGPNAALVEMLDKVMRPYGIYDVAAFHAGALQDEFMEIGRQIRAALAAAGIKEMP